MAAFHTIIRQKQLLVAGVAVVLMMLLLGGIMGALFLSDQPGEAPKAIACTSQIESASTRIDPKEVWVEQIQNETKLLKSQVEALEKLMLENVKLVNQKDQEIEYLQNEIKEGYANQNNRVELPDNNHYANPAHAGNLSGLQGGESLPGFPGASYPPAPSSSELNAPAGIKKVVLNLSTSSKDAKKDKKTVENTIPAGAYARAVLMGGVDASTSIQAQGDPRPVLLRLTDAGNLPRKFKSDLKSCHVLASSYGDLSSERVYMRLEKLTCTEPLTGEIIETQVAGYVTGEDGRAGVRGTIVDRAGEAVRGSLVGGFLSGMSQFLGAQQQNSVFPVSPFGQTNALAPQRMLGAGAAQGAGNAMEKYAEFFIRRAEQLQPVIQVAAGRSVDIVFTQGTSIGDSTVKQTLHKIREESRRETVSDLQNTADDKQWLPNQ